MKTTIYALSILVVLFIVSCKDTAIHSPLVGRWRVVGYYISIGGPLEYTPASKQDNGYVQFNENGIFRSNVYDDAATYSIKDNKTVAVTYDDSKPNYYATHAYKTYYFSYGFKNDTLSMSPAGPVVCIEGCSALYVRY